MILLICMILYHAIRIYNKKFTNKCLNKNNLYKVIGTINYIKINSMKYINTLNRVMLNYCKTSLMIFNRKRKILINYNNKNVNWLVHS